MKNFIAKISAVAMVLTLALANNVSAAGILLTGSTIDAGRQIITLALPAGVDLEAGDDITVTLTTTSNGAAVALNANNFTAATLGAGNLIADGDIGAAGTAGGVVAITTLTAEPADGDDLTLSLTNALANNTAYTVTYVDSDGNYGSIMINTGTSNQVAVTARVVPTLTFSLSSQAIALGDLTVGAYKTGAVDMTYATNANSGLVVTMTSTGLVGDNAKEIGAGINAGVTDTTGTDFYKLQSEAVTGGVAFTAFDDANNGIGNAAGNAMSLTQSVGNLAGAGANGAATNTVTIGAKIAAETEAGNYSDTLTFIATASF